jgi:hypothetical protein
VARPDDVREPMTRVLASFTNDDYEEEKYGEQEGTTLGRIQIRRSFDGAIEGSSNHQLALEYELDA